ncbi:hypothetical protein [Neobacillus dielmonensis]|uniref:hypothetical protein n=1 Tax=Neobacillus dielmonensis TaxID=1347369 RepID=UPI0005A6B1A1|nr:hypothetical protein [Neobacillus dielmonensis]
MADTNMPHQEFESSSHETRHHNFWDRIVLGTAQTPGRMQDESSSSSSESSSSHLNSFESSSTESSSSSHFSTGKCPDDLVCTEWYTSDDGRYKIQSCWKDGNMWVYKRKRKRR